MNKKLIAILTLVMFAITLLPMGAFAASKNTAIGSIPTITQIATGQTLATIRLDGEVAGNITNGFFAVTLPSGVSWDTTTPAPSVAAGPGAIAITDTTARTRTFQITGIPVVPTAETIVAIPVVGNVTSVGTGDIVATIQDSNAGITSGTLVIGTFSSGNAVASALSTKTTGGAAPDLGTIRIVENSAGALAATKKITLTLPNNMTWRTPTPNIVVSGGTLALTPVGSTTGRTVTFEVATPSTTGPAIIDIPTPITIDDKAAYGDVTVTIGGDASITTSSVVIGKYADFAVTVSAATAKDVLAGKVEQEAAEITIKEGLDGSILPSRSVKLVLPSGVKFTTPSTMALKYTAGDTGLFTSATPTFNTDLTEATFNVKATGSTSATTVVVENMELDIAANKTGEVKVKIQGTAGVSGEVTVANVKKTVEITADAKTVKMGVQGQAIGEILISETMKEALEEGAFNITLPTGFAFSKLATIEVVEGDMEIKDVERATLNGESNRILRFTVDSQSTTPSKIKVTNVAISANRSVPEGDVNATISGAAVMQSVFANVTSAASVKIATVTTPAEDGVVQPVVMTVGSTVYTIDGVEMTMDVAPYIKDARTYFPVRYVAQALGITADNVVWDGAQRTVTIFRANRIVQVTIGSTTMLVNGVPLTMDAAPEITAERTMLPIRFVAQGLGVNVNWDAATQTVTLN